MPGGVSGFPDIGPALVMARNPFQSAARDMQELDDPDST
jgi:hypothetical protein